ncbi:MAG: CvpA family protein [Acidobacteriota bacterium]
MNALDVAIVAIACIPTLIGLAKGLVNVGTALVGTWAAFLLAPLIASLLHGPLRSALGHEGLAEVLAYAAGFVTVLLAVGVAGWLLTRSLKKLDLNWVNRLGGAFLGLACGILLSGVLVAAVNYVGPSSALRQGSVLAGPLTFVTGWLVRLPERQTEGEAEPSDGGTEEGAPASTPATAPATGG